MLRSMSLWWHDALLIRGPRCGGGSRLCGAPQARCTASGTRGLTKRAAQSLGHLQQRGVVLDDVLGAIDAGHRRRGEFSARGQRNKAVEDRLVALAEQPLII